MIGRPRIWIVQDRRVIHVKGRGAAALIRDAGYRPYYVGSVRAYMLDVDRLADFTAFLDSRRISFEVTTLARVQPCTPEPQTPEPESPQSGTVGVPDSGSGQTPQGEESPSGDAA